MSSFHHAGAASHYPSWGFETVQFARDIFRAEHFLITPHGDLKLGFRKFGARSIDDSLPLMGI